MHRKSFHLNLAYLLFQLIPVCSHLDLSCLLIQFPYYHIQLHQQLQLKAVVLLWRHRGSAPYGNFTSLISFSTILRALIIAANTTTAAVLIIMKIGISSSCFNLFQFQNIWEPNIFRFIPPKSELIFYGFYDFIYILVYRQIGKHLTAKVFKKY